MNLPMLLVLAGGTLAVGYAESEPRTRYALFKAIAAIGFLWLGLAFGLAATPWGALALAGLLASAFGDVALAFHGRTPLFAGLGAFATAHLLYTAAFLAMRPSALRLMLIGLLVAAVSFLAVRWLLPHVEVRAMRMAVSAYVILISLMVTCGSATLVPQLAIGTWAFYLSDLAVARQRFVTAARINTMVGLPLYYLAQVLIVLGVAAWRSG